MTETIKKEFTTALFLSFTVGALMLSMFYITKDAHADNYRAVGKALVSINHR